MSKLLIKDNQNRTTEADGFIGSDFIDAFDGSQSPVKTGIDGKIDSSLLPPTSGTADAAKEIEAVFTYGQTISALKLVYVGLDGKIYPASNDIGYDEARVVGMTKLAGNLNQQRPVLVFGRIDDPSFTYPTNTDLFLGTLGNIVAIAPTAGHYKPIGRSLGPGSIFLDIGTTIIL
jgi:hypothetical protein